MTEDYWLSCASPEPLLLYLKDKVSDRKLRLYACYCARDAWQVFDEAQKRFIESMERSLCSFIDMPKETPAFPYPQQHFGLHYAIGQVQFGGAWAAAWNIGGEVRQHVGITSAAMRDQEPPRQADRVREMFGNPFRPTSVDPTWRTPTVKQLADAIYVYEDFAGLPILSDALEEAGCDNMEILIHLRQPGPHIRGCWALDLVLDKE